MTDIPLTKLRKQILEKCRSHHGELERRWQTDETATKAIQFLVAQKLLRREVGDDAKGFANRIITTERGIALLNGDLIRTL